MAYRLPQTNLIPYHVSKWLVVEPVFKLLYGIRLENRGLVPRQGPFIAVCNHASNLDPLIVGYSLNRPTAFMAKEELFQVPVLKDVMWLFGAFPVKRGAVDRAAIRAALEALEAGWAVGLFIQGTRTLDGRVDDPQPGAALIAAKARVPLLPVSVLGSEVILPKGATRPRAGQLTVRFSPLIDPPASTKREDLDRVTQQCTEAINRSLVP